MGISLGTSTLHSGVSFGTATPTGGVPTGGFVPSAGGSSGGGGSAAEEEFAELIVGDEEKYNEKSNTFNTYNEQLDNIIGRSVNTTYTELELDREAELETLADEIIGE